MLDVIADFWKPVKKAQTQEKLQPEQLQVGSSLGFGFVPQSLLSGRRLTITSINTYQFGDEALTSFVLTQDKDPGVSMIVAESEGEHYLAISRRIAINDRIKLFDASDLENVMSKNETTRLACKDNVVDYKGWVVSSYKREIQGLKGRIFKGDFRKSSLPSNSEAQEFEYTLLVSDSNEHAIEIEKYQDGRIEVYATVYRRMSDIGEINHPGSETPRPDIKLASSEPLITAAEPPSMLETAITNVVGAASTLMPKFSEEPKADAKAESLKPQFTFDAPKVEPVKAEPVKAEEPKFEPKVEPRAEPIKLADLEREAPAPITAIRPDAAEKTASAMMAGLSSSAQQENFEPRAASYNETTINGTRNDMSSATDSMKPKLYVQPTAPENYNRQEVKAVTNKSIANFEADAIECDLRVANKIIDEAIRNEMRLTDIVRRIIELPVAYPESVQIPVTLTDEDYALLAIRYGVSSSDRNTIKRRIIEDLNDFSGDKTKKAA